MSDVPDSKLTGMWSAMRGPRVQHKAEGVRPDWSWQPERAKKQDFDKAMREKEKR